MGISSKQESVVHMDTHFEIQRLLGRRAFLGEGLQGIGAIALGSLILNERSLGGETGAGASRLAGLPHFAPQAKRVICLFQSGGLSHVDLFDNKPTLAKYHGEELPASIKGTQRLTGMTSRQ